MMESVVYLFFKGESGILFFPWTPIYGLGVVIVIFCYNLFKDKIKNKWVKYFLVFLTGFILLSILELIGGILIEKIFGYVFWNYDDLTFNFGHYIALEISLVWGFASMIIVKIIPLTDKIVKKIPRSISWLFIILMICDVAMTVFTK